MEPLSTHIARLNDASPGPLEQEASEGHCKDSEGQSRPSVLTVGAKPERCIKQGV